MIQLAGVVIAMDKNRTIRRLHKTLSKKERRLGLPKSISGIPKSYMKWRIR